jgi:hypothetical protein
MLYALVFLNESESPNKWLGFQAGDPLKLAYTFEPMQAELFPTRAQDRSVCEQAFVIGNMDAEMAASPTERRLIERYRERRNRSVSVGDLVAVQRDDALGVVIYSCQSAGWEEVDPGALDESVISMNGREFLGREMTRR